MSSLSNYFFIVHKFTHCHNLFYFVASYSFKAYYEIILNQKGLVLHLIMKKKFFTQKKMSRIFEYLNRQEKIPLKLLENLFTRRKTNFTDAVVCSNSSK